jgi:hypothetical protein
MSGFQGRGVYYLKNLDDRRKIRYCTATKTIKAIQHMVPPKDKSKPRTEGAVTADRERRQGENRQQSQPLPREYGGPRGPEPTRFGDWERKGRCVDF